LATPPTLTNINNLLTDIKTAWEANMLPILSNQYTVSQYHDVALTSATGVVATLVNSPPIAGGTSGAALPANVSLCLTKRTALRGRSYRGRMYVPGMLGANQAGVSDFTTVFVGNAITALASFLTSANFHTFVFSVVSYFLNKVARTTGVSTPVAAISADTASDSQRRRLLGRGA